MPVRRLNHAVLYVNGLDREVDFYTRTLGFEVRLRIPGQAAFLRSPGSANDHDLGLFDVGAGHADGRPSVGLYHLAWEVGTLAELVETRQKLVDAGALVGRAITGCPSRCTPRTRAASSSRCCGGCRSRTGTASSPAARATPSRSTGTAP